MISRRLFNFVKAKIPKISNTELIALRSGNTSIDRQILQNTVKFPEKFVYENKFPESKINSLLNDFDNPKSSALNITFILTHHKVLVHCF